ncbi:MAG: cation diffusion facilitator family transporter [Paludibacteraceae bacterium]|nr:cation diffusion facilitator family transporter [Paludibacteraceae bacterium]
MDNRLKQIETVTIWGAVCNVALTVVKFIAGTLGGSAAMVADAVHSLSDLISDGIVLVFARVSSKKCDHGHDYGHGRFETLATLAVSLLLLVVAGEMLADAVQQIVAVSHGETITAPGLVALWAALLSIATKEALYQWTARVGKRINSPVMIANAWHHRTDAISSVASAAGIAGAAFLGGRWAILDPLVGGVISIVILVVGVRMALPALQELTDASLPDETEQQILAIMSSVEGVHSVHQLKTRQMGHYFVVDAHVVVDSSLTVAEAHVITDHIEAALCDTYGHETHISLHVEPMECAEES